MKETQTRSRFSATEFRHRAAAQDPDLALDAYGDHRLNPDLKTTILREGLHDAAVLVPVVDYGDEATVILTERSAKLRSHSGQIALPGGRIDPTDVSPEHAALREAEEEIGLPPPAPRWWAECLITSVAAVIASALSCQWCSRVFRWC